MITEIKIQNFKSVADLTLPLGRVNVLIGANGSGKSNILEAIAFGGAASADRLDNEFLGPRGIRATSAQLMKSAFSFEHFSKPIQLNFKSGTNESKFIIEEDQKPILKWKITSQNQNTLPSNHPDDFIIYSPEISSLRKFEEESQIKPLGIKGEGLFSILQIFYENENYGAETINEIRKYLHIIDWFDDFKAIFDKETGRNSLVVKDRNIPGVSLNQTNVNEGFLFLLFYISLILSKETPAFFAIDNIEASFHPLLCEELIKILVKLSQKHNKQLILTTHNPFVLDGLDLTDPEQKLFVVRRNGDGETIADDIKPVKNVKLSEAWMRGYIGGNPETIY